MHSIQLNNAYNIPMSSSPNVVLLPRRRLNLRFNHNNLGAFYARDWAPDGFQRVPVGYLEFLDLNVSKFISASNGLRGENVIMKYGLPFRFYLTRKLRFFFIFAFKKKMRQFVISIIALVLFLFLFLYI